jgi:hypothetical protein
VQVLILPIENQIIGEPNSTNTIFGFPRNFFQLYFGCQTLHLNEGIPVFDSNEEGNLVFLQQTNKWRIGIKGIKCDQNFVLGMTCRICGTKRFAALSLQSFFCRPSWRTMGSTATGKTVFSPGCTQTAASI